MGASSDQIERQIAEVRSSLEAKIVELRARGRRRVRAASRMALVALAAGAAVGVAVVGIFVVHRLTRPPTRTERLRRLMPRGLAGLPLDVRHTRRRALERLKREVPPVRLYVGDRQVGEEPRVTHWERLVVRAAQAAGTAAAGALATRLAAALADALRSRRE
ncbi:MAG TPA: hypothetical protein VKF59_08485 [Candidatus Dormibacteraeota bacterium]|nr:hypothetical protein [Candidatus Dormibacteraeota bacterium]